MIHKIVPSWQLIRRIWLITLLVFNGLILPAQEKIPILLDADTGNEVDDVFALARALAAPQWQVVALNATHWQTSHWAVPQTMENSHRLNQVILGHMGLSIPTKRGGVARLFDWGDQAQYSAAAHEIIKQARQLPKGKTLQVVALGALTNVASALLIAPDIAPRITLYWLGTSYKFDEDLLKTTDFNCVMDIQAVDIVFNSTVSMHIIPVNVAAAMQLNYDRMHKQLAGKNAIADFMLHRWYTHLDGGTQSRVIWDLALIEALLHPEWAEQVQVTTPKALGQRQVYYYKSIQHEAMRRDFYEILKSFSP